MKKILCVMVAVVLCFGAVLVTASAETPMYNYNGVSMPYPPEELANTEYQYFMLFEESNGNYTLVASSMAFKFSANYNNTEFYVFANYGSNYEMYSIDDGMWVRFGGVQSSEFKKFSSYDSLFWSSYTFTPDFGLTFEGDTKFVFPPPKPSVPLHEEINGVTGEAVNGFANDTFDTLGVLVPIGIGIMAVFLGVALIPRVIFKFL